MTLQESGEMYLETILILSDKGPVRVTDISEYMNFSKPSVSRAMGLLKDAKYITIEDNKITLTKIGKKIAENIYSKHKILSSFLMKLGVSEKTAVDDACKIEHDISEESFNVIKNYMSK